MRMIDDGDDVVFDVPLRQRSDGRPLMPRMSLSMETRQLRRYCVDDDDDDDDARRRIHRYRGVDCWMTLMPSDGHTAGTRARSKMTPESFLTPLEISPSIVMHEDEKRRRRRKRRTFRC